MNELPADFIQEADGRIKIAPERFKSAGEISDTCNMMVLADRRRIPWRAAIDGLINGNPTYTFNSLKAKGQAWRARVNYREAEGLLNARQTPFYDLVTEVNPCIEICLDYGKGTDQTDWAQKIAKAYHWILMKKWRVGFNYHISLQQLEMLKHGIGYHIWPDTRSRWIPDTPLTGSILFPDGVSLNTEEKLDYFMLRDFLPGFALYAKIRNEKVATDLGWNVDAVWNALAHSSKNKQRADNRWNIEIFQREMKAGDIGTTQSRQSGLWLNHLFCRDIETGSWSQYTVAETMVPGTGKKSGDPFGACLYRKRAKFPKLSDLLVMFPYDIGSGGELHTVRGLGARTKDFFELSNRIYNAMADQVMMGSRINVTQTGPTDPDKLKLMHLGLLNIVPAGLAIAPGVQFPPLAQGPIAFTQLLKGTVRENNESYMQGTPEPQDRETGMSYMARMQNAGQVGKGVHSLYASNYQRLQDKMFRTMSRKDAGIGPSWSAQLARDFRAQLVKDKVPLDALDHVYEVNEVFSTGAGSPAMRLAAILQAIQGPIYQMAPEDKKINMERDYAAALFSGTKVDRYARSLDDNELPDQDDSFATQENNGLAQGGDAEVASSQDHVEHLKRHLAKSQEIVQAVYNGQIPPPQGLAIIQKFGKHEGDHLGFLQSNPMRKAEFAQLHEQWAALSVIADKLQQQIEAQAAAQPQQPPQQQVSEDLQVGMAKVAAGERVGLAKVASKGKIDLAQLAINSRLEAAKTAAAIRQNGSRPTAARA